MNIQRFLRILGDIALLNWEVFKSIDFHPNVVRRTIKHIKTIGIDSIFITSITSLFVGMVFTIQVSNEFSKFGALKLIGGIVGMAIWRELAPLFTGVILCSRVGASIASELSTMKVTEQIDALKTLGQNPVAFLVTPRFLAAMISVPLLVGLADTVGFLGGFIVSCIFGQVNPAAYFNSAQTMLSTYDIWAGIFKGFCFSGAVVLISCYQGMKTKNGAKGVGDSVTISVVASLICIFILNYFLSLLLF